MSFALLWIELSAIGLLWVGALAALIARLRRRWVRGTLLTLVFLAPLLILGPLTGVSIYAMIQPTSLKQNWLFGYINSLTLFYVAGAITILILSRRRQVPDGPQAAANWPRGRLSAALTVAVALATMTLWNMDLAAQTQAAMIRAEAGAISLSIAPPPVPDSRNAALLYEQAFQLLEADQSWRGDRVEAENHPFQQDKPDTKDPAVAAFLEKHAPSLALARQAATMPDCFFEHDYGHPSMSLLLPELSSARYQARLLRLHARYELAQGHSEAALEDVQAMFRMAGHIGQSPLLISGLMAIAIDYRAIQTLEEVLPAVTSAPLLARLELPDGAGISRLQRRSIRGEEAFGLAALADLMSGQLGPQVLTLEEGNGSPTRRQFGIIFLRIFVLAEELRPYRNLLRLYQQLAAKPYYQIKTQLAETNTKISQERGFFIRMLLPSLDSCFVQAAKTAALCDAARVAVAARRYQLEQGHLPAGMEELVPKYLPAIPLDPFDGQPLRMTIKPGEVVIYSIGPDGKNNGELTGNRTQDQQIETLTVRMKAAPQN